MKTPPETPAEIVEVGKAAGLRNRTHRQIRLIQKMNRLLDADLDLGLRGVDDRVAHVIDERMLREHVAQQVADRVIFVVQCECRCVR